MKYTKDKNTFFAKPKDDPKDRIELEIGDSKQADFFPQVKIMRWDNECNVSIRLKETEVGVEKVETKADKIVWSKGNIEANFYDLNNSEHPEGAIEFDITLKEKPLTNVMEFTIVDKDIEYCYQTPLTPEQIAQGDSRPENVEGSYVVYAKTPKTNWEGGKEYKCSQIGIIFRPKIIDSAGTEVWGILHIENGILSVTIPQDFLDKAVYPVRHASGLTFGYETVGATQNNSVLAGDISLCKYSLSESGNVTKLTYYTRSSVGAINTKGLIYDDDGGSGYPGTLMGITDVYNPDTTFGWDDAPFASPVALTAGDWWLGSVPQSGYVYIAWNEGTANQRRYYTGDVYTSPSNPFPAGASGTARNVSIYATYSTASAGPAK